MIEPVGTEEPRITLLWIASMSIAWYIAWRTRTSLNGFLPFTFEYRSSSRYWSMPRKMVRFSLPSTTFALPPDCRRAMSCGGGSRTKSISPERSAATRVASALIGT